MIQKIYRYFKSKFPRKGDVYWNSAKGCYMVVVRAKGYVVHCRTSFISRSDAYDVFTGHVDEIENPDLYHTIDVGNGKMVRIGFNYKMTIFKHKPSLAMHSNMFMSFSETCAYITKIPTSEMVNFENRMYKVCKV